MRNQNLAGVACNEATRQARRELEFARARVVNSDPGRSEVQSLVSGLLTVNGREYTLTRAWYYWVVRGDVPLEIAMRIYDDAASDDIRAAGDAGCSDPRDHVKWLSPEGNLFVDAKEQAECERLQEKGMLTIPKHWRFVEKPSAVGIPFVDMYHIDSALGLRVFVDYLTGANYAA